MTRTQPNKGIPRHRERGIRMSEFKVIEIKKNILEDNDREADVLRSELKADRTFLLNLMSSPGSGKTTTLVRTIGALKDEMRIGVMEADIDSDEYINAALDGSMMDDYSLYVYLTDASVE